MRLKLFLLLALFATLTALAQREGVQGVVIDAKSGLPVAGATVILDNQGNAATTDSEGLFIIDDAVPGSDKLLVLAYGYNDWSRDVTIVKGTWAQFRLSLFPLRVPKPWSSAMPWPTWRCRSHSLRTRKATLRRSPC